MLGKKLVFSIKHEVPSGETLFRRIGPRVSPGRTLPKTQRSYSNETPCLGESIPLFSPSPFPLPPQTQHSSAASSRNHGQTLKTEWFLSNETCRDIHWQNCCGTDSSKLFCWSLDGKKYRIGNVWFVFRKQGLFLSVYADGIKMAGREQKMAPMWKKWMKLVNLGEPPSSFLDYVKMGCIQRECNPNESIVDEYRKHVRIKDSCRSNGKLHVSEKSDANISSWSCDMEGNAKKCVDRYCELANKNNSTATQSRNTMH